MSSHFDKKGLTLVVANKHFKEEEAESSWADQGPTKGGYHVVQGSGARRRDQINNAMRQTNPPAHIGRETRKGSWTSRIGTKSEGKRSYRCGGRTTRKRKRRKEEAKISPAKR